MFFQILLDDAEPRDAETTWLSSPVRRCDSIIAVSLCCFVSLCTWSLRSSFIYADRSMGIYGKRLHVYTSVSLWQVKERPEKASCVFHEVSVCTSRLIHLLEFLHQSIYHVTSDHITLTLHCICHILNNNNWRTTPVIRTLSTTDYCNSLQHDARYVLVILSACISLHSHDNLVSSE